MVMDDLALMLFFFFQAEDGIRDYKVTGLQTCALPIYNGVLAFTEAGTKRRASLHLVEGKAALDAMNPGGVEVMEVDLRAFRERLIGENHTLKRALTEDRKSVV